MRTQNKPTKRVTVVVSNNRTKKNKSRSKAPQFFNLGSASNNLGQKRQAPIARTTQTSQNNRVVNYRFPKRREMIDSITGNAAGDFVLFDTIKLNPGDPSFSTWLANIALCFESYKFHSLKFIYIPRCPTTTTGDIFLCPDSNPKDLQPVTEIEASQNEKCKSSAPWDHFDIVLPREMLNKRKTYFCRKQGVTPNGADIDLYDSGNLFIFNGGQSDNKKIGQLWVEYEVEFFTPEGTPILNVPETVFSEATNNLTAANPIAGSNLASEGVGQSLSISSVDGTITALKDFHGLLNWQLIGTGIGTPTFPATGGASTNLTEDGYGVGGSTINTVGGSIQRILNMPQGSTIKPLLSAATTLTRSSLSLSNCFL